MKKKFISLLSVLFFLFLFAYGCSGQKKQTDNSKTNITNATDINQEAKDLYLSSLLVGKGLDKYSYSYEEDRNGYIVKTTLIKNKNESKITVQIPLSKRTVYFMENSIVLCLSIKESDEVCAYAENSTYVNDYIRTFQDSLLDDKKMLKTVEDSSLLAERGLLTFNSVEDKELELGKCAKINFNIDYSKLTIQEASRFGLGSGSPLFFSGYFCVDRNSKQAYEKYFNYTFRGQQVYTHFKLISYDFNTEPEIQIPKNISNRLATTLIEEEKEKLSDFLSCYKKVDAGERESCIYSYSIYNKEFLSCKYADSKSDRCFLNVAVARKDANICQQVPSLDYEEDCYIEIAGLNKDNSLCSSIKNETKMARCNQVSNSTGQVIVPTTSHVDRDAIEIANYNETKESERRDKVANEIAYNE